MTVWDGTSVKCWWTIPRPAAIASRGEPNATGAPVDEDLALVGPVEPGEDVHQGALAGAVLAEQRVDLAGPQVEVDVVVGEDARETLDDPARLDGERRGARRRLVPGAVAAVIVDVPSGCGEARGRPPAGLESDCLAGQRWAADGDALVPPVHADRALRARGAGRELVEVGLLELLAGRQELLAGVVLDRPGEDVEPAERRRRASWRACP